MPVTIRWNRDAGEMSPDVKFRINRVVAIVLITVGALLAGGAVYVTAPEIQFVAVAARATGRVIENREEDWKDRDSFSYRGFHAIVRFVDASGEVVVHRDKIGVSPPLFHVGDVVTILYDPQHPVVAMIDRGIANYLFPICAGGFGLLLILGGVRRLQKYG